MQGTFKSPWIALVILIGCTFGFTQGKSCNYKLHALPSWGTVSSPGFPRRFPPQTQCSWRITAPPQFRVQLELTTFELVAPNNKNQCIWQWLNIIETSYDAEDSQQPMLTLCGRNRPRLVISSGNSLTVNLHSNSAAVTGHYRGFSARYKYTSESAYVPDISNKLSHPEQRVGMDPAPSPSIQTLGDVLGPFMKKKPKPKNPNAVKELQNRRTEMENRARNEGTSLDNNINAADPYAATSRRPSNYPRPIRRPLPTTDVNINREDQVPPQRSKPLPHEITILLAVLGTVGAIALILYIIKKIAYDKAHKTNSGRIMHAYAHFRRFRKKKVRKTDEESQNNVKTVSGTSQNMPKSNKSKLDTVSQENRGTMGSHKSEVRPTEEYPERNLHESIPRCGSDEKYFQPVKGGLERGVPLTQVVPRSGNPRSQNRNHRQPRSTTHRSKADGTSDSDSNQVEQYYKRERYRRPKREGPGRAVRSRDARSEERNQPTRTTNAKGAKSRSRVRNSRNIRRSRESRSSSISSDSSYRGRRGSPDRTNKRSTWRDRAYS